MFADHRFMCENESCSSAPSTASTLRNGPGRHADGGSPVMVPGRSTEKHPGRGHPLPGAIDDDGEASLLRHMRRTNDPADLKLLNKLRTSP